MSGMNAKAAGRTAANAGTGETLNSTSQYSHNSAGCQNSPQERYNHYLALADKARAGIMPAELRGDWQAVRRYKRRCALYGSLATACRRVLLPGGDV